MRNSLALSSAPTDMIEVTATDETSHITKFTTDAMGEMTKRVKLKGATPIAMQYARDVLGRIVGVIDPQLNK